jgi:hypothetical protein|tara:strand:- start:278 stop:715 length:438 start_codon:yes stop_codon:yes gene_type:complete
MVSERGVVTFPIPLYQNVEIREEYYIPQRYVIDDITLGQTTTVITDGNHDYVVGQQIRFLIPANFGSYQLNNVKGIVISVPSLDQLVIDVDSSRNVDPFLTSATVTTASPQIIAIGDVNSGVINRYGRTQNGTFIPGSFINISPQ